MSASLGPRAGHPKVAALPGIVGDSIGRILVVAVEPVLNDLKLPLARQALEGRRGVAAKARVGPVSPLIRHHFLRQSRNRGLSSRAAYQAYAAEPMQNDPMRRLRVPLDAANQTLGADVAVNEMLCRNAQPRRNDGLGPDPAATSKFAPPRTAVTCRP